MTKAKGHLLPVPSSATPEEAAAIVAAIERFVRATAPARAPRQADAPGGWRAAAILEGVSREPFEPTHEPWLTAAQILL